jgi:23S rRNA (uracil1939-C5)-methyltransferase
MNDHSTFEVAIEKLVYRGSGLGRLEGKVVFVPFSGPGDRLLVRTVREKKDFIVGEIHNILKEIICHKFPVARDISVTMTKCPQPFAYRSRARIQLRRSGKTLYAGFYRWGSHAVEAIENCILLRPSLNRALKYFKSSENCKIIGSKFRELDIAGSCEDDLWSAAPCGIDNGSDAIPEAWNFEKRIKRKVGEFEYAVTASAFFQANDFLIQKLVEIVCEMAGSGNRNAALDLFAGAGLFSLPLADLYSSVVAVEHSPAASQLAADNASAARIDHLKISCADVAHWLDDYTSSATNHFDLVLLDPPRSGAGAGIMKQICNLNPQTIIYVSCDPQTLVRDLSFLPGDSYRINRIEGLDMFPQTYHFETVVQLIRQ